MAAPTPRPVPRLAAASMRERAMVRAGANGAEANRRAEIVRLAARLFREHGFDGTTVRDIAAAVGMRSGSPFYHFASKEEILFAVMEEGLRQGLARTEAVLARHSGARDRFVALMRAQFDTILESGSDFVPVMLYEWRRLPHTYRKRLIALKDRYDALWQGVIEDLVAAGSMRGDAKLARLLILGAVNFTATWFKRGGGLSIDEIARASAEFFLVPATGPKVRRKGAR
ncbi:MAG TPA: TetR/AcrR family transcriptional regulator [Burkholderiaceae bacterium]|nr:TetR/AcrR family transcriptional regulator [Burkholderiaceae bacterium]